MKKIALSLSLLILLCTISAFAQNAGGLPRVAIYMAGVEPHGARGIHKVLGAELAKFIGASGRYQVIDRTSATREQIEQEHLYQRSGAVSDEQIKNLGIQFGVDLLCVAEVAVIREGHFLIGARLVNIETAEVLTVASVSSNLRDGAATVYAAEQVAERLLSGGAKRLISGRTEVNAGYQSTSYETMIENSGGAYLGFGAAGYLRIGRILYIGLGAGLSAVWDEHVYGDSSITMQNTSVFWSPVCRLGTEKRHGEFSFTMTLPVSAKRTVNGEDADDPNTDNMFSIDLSGRFDSFGGSVGYSFKEGIVLLNAHGFIPVYKTIEAIPSVSYAIGDGWGNLAIGIGIGMGF